MLDTALSNNEQAFFALLKAGLWERGVQFLPYEQIDFSAIQELAEEQSVVGLIAAGIEHVVDTKVPKIEFLQFIGQSLRIEEQNKGMNQFIGVMVDKMKMGGINTLLVKGQGIAQCYERPLWRSCGDVDFLLSDDDYEKAKTFLAPLATSIEPENLYEKHQGMTFDSWLVELHGNLYCGLSHRIEKGVEDIKNSIINGGKIRSWMNDSTPIALPRADEDVLIIFTHFLKHFYRGGICIRQICDWCRMLWTFGNTINKELLEKRVRKMGLISEWKAFAALSVDYLGMPAKAMPLYDSSRKWNEKAERIVDFILTSGKQENNLNIDKFHEYPFFIRKAISLRIRCVDLFCHSKIFPWDSFKFLPFILFNGFREAIRGYKHVERKSE